MAAVLEERLVLLQAARLKGRLTPELSSAFLADRAQPLLDELITAGLLKGGGAVARLTPEGREHLAALLIEERTRVEGEALSRLYEEFEHPNTTLKAVITAWQVFPDGTPNDHKSGVYDRAVLGRLNEAAAQARPLVEQIAQTVARLGHYPQRLATALSRAEAGDHRFVAHPMVDSYHQVWFELHEDLLGLLGLSREAEARAGRAE
jgi:pyruvate,orthophosphate dikinase